MGMKRVKMDKVGSSGLAKQKIIQDLNGTSFSWLKMASFLKICALFKDLHTAIIDFHVHDYLNKIHAFIILIHTLCIFIYVLQMYNALN